MSNGLATRCIKDIQAEPVAFLWKPYLPVGKLSSLEGDPGIGKTWIALAIAAAISLGDGLPGQTTGEPGNVLLTSAEDGYSDTFRPRLDAMGADLDHIFVIEQTFSFDNEGFTRLEFSINDLRPKLLVIDPLQAYMGARIDIHRANETRPVLSQLTKIAEKYQIVILVIRHLSKGGTNKAIYRGLGSIDFTAAFRSVLLAGCDPEDPGNPGIVHIKSNLAAKGRAQGYQVTEGNFLWTGESKLTQAQILSGDDSADTISELDEAMAFLREELTSGPVSANTVYHDADSIGISKRTLDRAKAKMGVISRHLGEKGKRGGGDWIWEYPSTGNDPATQISGNLNNSEAKKPQRTKNLATSIKTGDQGERGGSQADDAPGAVDTESEPSLIIPRAAIIEIWKRIGKPLVWLGHGENEDDLELLLNHDTLMPRHIEALNKWVIKHDKQFTTNK